MNITTKNKKRKFTGTLIHSERGKVIGEVVNRDFLKDIDSSHILYKYNSIACDICSLHEAENAGAEYVEFTNTETGVTYRAPIEKFWTLGRFIDYGHGRQQALELTNFEHVRNTVTNTDAPEYAESNSSMTDDVMPLEYKSRAAVGVTYTAGRQTPKQLALFGGK